MREFKQMKLYANLMLVIIILSFTNSIFGQSQMPVIRSTSTQIDIRDGNDFSKGNWVLVPEAKPDIYTTTAKKRKKITFYSDVDSISFWVKPNKKYDFVILLNDKDSCWTQIKTRKEVPPANFSKKYMSSMDRKHSFEVPEVQELLHIVIALTPRGIADSNMVLHGTKYYDDVMKHFGNFKNEKVVQIVNQIVAGNYAHLKMDACGFYFDDDVIKKDKTYDRLNWSADNFAEPLVEQLEEFARKTAFRSFYNSKKTYYDSLLVLMKKQTPIEKQWTWVENNFPNKYNNYRITFSPLVNGSHSTNRFESNNFRQTVMFVCGPYENSRRSEQVTEGLMTRVVFTEIDHNYVNPTSDQYAKEINEVFSDRKKWAMGKDSDYYGNAISVFNEYMTWAVFTLYAYDNFNLADFAAINERTERQMAEWRGFIEFKKFNNKVLELYKNKNKETSIAELYPQILKWAAEQ